MNNTSMCLESFQKQLTNMHNDGYTRFTVKYVDDAYDAPDDMLTPETLAAALDGLIEHAETHGYILRSHLETPEQQQAFDMLIMMSEDSYQLCFTDETGENSIDCSSVIQTPEGLFELISANAAGSELAVNPVSMTAVSNAQTNALPLTVNLTTNLATSIEPDMSEAPFYMNNRFEVEEYSGTPVATPVSIIANTVKTQITP